MGSRYSHMVSLETHLRQHRAEIGLGRYASMREEADRIAALKDPVERVEAEVRRRQARAERRDHIAWARGERDTP